MSTTPLPTTHELESAQLGWTTQVVAQSATLMLQFFTQFGY